MSATEGSRLTDEQQLSIEALCRRLLMRYAVAVDRKDYDTFLTAFADNAVWKRPGQPPMTGVAQIRKFFELLEAKRRSPSTPSGHVQRHLFTTVHIEAIHESLARGTAYALVFREEQPSGGPERLRLPEVLVQYDDVFRLVAGQWLISEHDTQHVFRAADYGERITPAEAAAISAFG